MAKLSDFSTRPSLLEDAEATRSIVTSVPFRNMAEMLSGIGWLRSYPQSEVEDAVLDVVDAIGRQGGVLQLEKVERYATLMPDNPKAPRLVECSYLIRLRAAPKE